jgi:WD40 repeat protein
VLASAGWDKSVKLWDMTSGALLHSFEHDARISALAFVVDRRGASVLASASWDKTVRLWDVASGRPLHTLEHNAPVVSLAVAPPPAVSDDRQDGGFQIATGSWDGRVYLWTIDHGQRATATRDLVALHLEPVNDLAFNADGSRLASASDDKTIKVSTLRDQADGYIWQSSLDVQHSAQGAENEKWVAMITQGGVQVLDAEQGRVREAVSGYTGNANRIAFSTGDTSRIAIEADDLFEYYLDPRELMMCAGSMSNPASATQSADASMTELCAGVELDAAYASLWSRARSGLDWLR